MASANAHTDQIDKLSIGPYDQVMGFTQELINAGLKTLWKRPGVKKDFSLGNHELKFKDCTLGAPSIVIRYLDTAPNVVVLRLHIESGTLMYYANEDDEDMSPMNIKKWVFAYPVDIGLVNIPKDKIDALKDLIDVPADYSVSRLMFDMASIDSTKFEKTLSFLPSQVTSDMLQSMTTLLSVKKILEDDQKTLGYLCHVDNLSAPATFPPTSLQFQTYPWCDVNGTPVGEGLTGNSVLNYLLYNQMTGNRSAPTGTSRFLPWSANFTEGDASNTDDSSSILGTFVMCKDLFWNQYLIPMFKIINQCVHYKVWDLTVSTSSGSNYSSHVKKQVAANGSELPPAEWLGKETTENGSPIWVWTKNYDEGYKSDQTGWEIGFQANAWAHNTSTIRFYPGTNMIQVAGTTEVNQWCRLWRGVIDTAGTIHHDDQITRRLDWNFHLWLESVKDGGLQIRMETPIHTYTHVNDQRDVGYLNGTFWDNNKDNVLNQLGTFETDLANDLSNLHKLYYPAGGQLFYDNPVFARNGDVHASVKFNADAIATGDRNLGAKERVRPVGGDVLAPKTEGT